MSIPKTPRVPRPAATATFEPKDAELRRQLEMCAAFAAEQIAGAADQPSSDLDGAAELAATFKQSAPEEGCPLPDILTRLAPAISKSLNTAVPGYFAYIPSGGLPAAAMADLVSLMTNRYVGVAACAPALAQIEATAIGWLAQELGLPASAGGILTSGGSLSHLTAIVTARTDRLPEEFLSGSLYVSEQAHLSLAKAARIAGFPARAIRSIPVDGRCRMRVDALERAVAEDRAAGRRPFLIVATAGTTNTGAIDPLKELASLARREGLWLHVDAAYGGFFRLCPEGAERLQGIEQADSITLDPHKGLFLPYGTGCLLVRDPKTLRRAHAFEAHYLQDVAEADGPPSFTDLSPELSRDFRGLRVWLPIMLHGVRAFREALAEKLALARWAADRLRDEPLFQLLDEPQLSLVALRARPPRGDADAFGAELLRRVNARRQVFLSSTLVGGRYTVRLCILSFRSHQDRVEAAVNTLIQEARALGAAWR
ncbi:MAG TPA: aminotransferase class I/II-fold pyridoxal phosphate-dependent enzyme [Anaeromyxobacteraceae bacterium]|nr:aminotransferase class I/II-fold pyridoxal phosphate-dependent enzyme [Anaeromyxobacteraceae bacterium]